MIVGPEELKRRTKEFAHRCVKLATTLPDTPLARHIRNQLIRSSTSVAAYYRATCLAQSKAQFSAKISIAIEEVDESAFWIEFAMEESLISQTSTRGLLKEGYELTSIFIASRITSKT
jgi:four helix bundle protein